MGGLGVEGVRMMACMALVSFLSLVQETAEDRLKMAVRRYERELLELEDSMVELGPAGLLALKALGDGPPGDVRGAAARAIARIEEWKPRLEEWIRNLGAAAVEKREEAHKALKKAGRAAHAYLEEASRSPDKEVASRASDLLGKNRSSSEPPDHEVLVVEAPAARKEVVIKEEPPPPRQEVIVGVAPSPNHVWVGGYWAWNGKTFVWIFGGWHPRPRPGAVWVEGRWERRTEGWVRVAGRWK
jgi:hypothetical protein